MPTFPVRNVIFDFGGVLVRWAPHEVVDRFTSHTGLRSLLMQSIFRHPDWLEVDRGTLKEPQAIARFAARTGLTETEIAVLLQRIRESLTPIPESVSLLRHLARHGVPLFGLSNMPGDTFRFLRSRYDFWSLFQGIVISGDIGMIKPEPSIFAHLMTCHGLSCSESVFIDDHESNVVAARQAGLTAIHFQDAASCALDLYPLIGISPEAHSDTCT